MTGKLDFLNLLIQPQVNHGFIEIQYLGTEKRLWLRDVHVIFVYPLTHEENKYLRPDELELSKRRYILLVSEKPRRFLALHYITTLRGVRHGNPKNRIEERKTYYPMVYVYDFQTGELLGEVRQSAQCELPRLPDHLNKFLLPERTYKRLKERAKLLTK